MTSSEGTSESGLERLEENVSDALFYLVSNVESRVRGDYFSIARVHKTSCLVYSCNGNILDSN